MSSGMAKHWIKCLGCFRKVYEPATACEHCGRALHPQACRPLLAIVLEPVVVGLLASYAADRCAARALHHPGRKCETCGIVFDAAAAS